MSDQKPLDVAARGYRTEVLRLIESLLPERGIPSALDVGAGDGWIASELLRRRLVGAVRAVDVQARPRSFVPVELYDGETPTWAPRSFDLVYAIDVVHHARRPLALLDLMMAASARYLLLKDHTYRTPLGWMALSALDELGNRRFGVPSLYHYQQGWAWCDHIERAGFKRVAHVHPARVEKRFFGALTNGLQFVALWERTAP